MPRIKKNAQEAVAEQLGLQKGKFYFRMDSQLFPKALHNLHVSVNHKNRKTAMWLKAQEI